MKQNGTSVRNKERSGLLRVDYITWYRHKRGYDTTRITGQVAVHRCVFSFALGFRFITVCHDHHAKFQRKMETYNE